MDVKSEKKMKDNERLIKRLTGIWEEKWIKAKEIIKVKFGLLFLFKGKILRKM